MNESRLAATCKSTNVEGGGSASSAETTRDGEKEQSTWACQ